MGLFASKWALTGSPSLLSPRAPLTPTHPPHSPTRTPTPTPTPPAPSRLPYPHAHPTHPPPPAVHQALGLSPDSFVPVRYLSDSAIAPLLWNIAPTLLLIGFFAYMYRREASSAIGGGAQSIFSVGKSKAKMYNLDQEIKVRYRCRKTKRE